MKQSLKEQSRRKKIFLCGSFHGNNIGDLAILESEANVLSKDYDLIILSKNPEIVQAKIHLPSNIQFAKATNIFAIFKSIFISNIVIIGGGGLFFDKGFFDVLAFWKGSQINVWWFVTFVARILFKKVYWLGVGMGPLTGWGLHKIRISLPFIDNIHVRDRSSLKILEESLKYKKAQKSADWVFCSTTTTQVEIAHKGNSNVKSPKLGLCFKLSESSNKKLQTKLKIIRSIISDLKREYPNHELVLFSTNPLKDSDLTTQLSKITNVEYIDTSTMNLEDFRVFLSQFSLIISERMHALLIGFQEGVIGIGISEMIGNDILGKVAEFQRELYDKDMYVIGFDFDDIRKLMQNISINNEEIRKIAIENYEHMSTLAKDNVSILE